MMNDILCQLFCPWFTRSATVYGQKKEGKEKPCANWLYELKTHKDESLRFDVTRKIENYYKLEKSTGHGATSTVFLCTNKKTKKKFAAKRVDKKKMLAMVRCLC